MPFTAASWYFNPAGARVYEKNLWSKLLFIRYISYSPYYTPTSFSCTYLGPWRKQNYTPVHQWMRLGNHPWIWTWWDIFQFVQKPEFFLPIPYWLGSNNGWAPEREKHDSYSTLWLSGILRLITRCPMIVIHGVTWGPINGRMNKWVSMVICTPKSVES